jgi:hypothetical protein
MRLLAGLDTKNEACAPSDYFALNEERAKRLFFCYSILRSDIP